MSVRIYIWDESVSIDIDGDEDHEFQFEISAHCDNRGAYLMVFDQDGNMADGYYEI